MVFLRMLALVAVSLSVVSCDRHDEAGSQTSAPTVSSSDYEAMPITEQASDNITTFIKNSMIPVFKEVEGGLELLPGCEYPGTYKYEASIRSSGTVQQTSTGATLRVSVSGADALEAGVERQKSHQAETSQAGYLESLTNTPTIAEFQDCPEVTHVAKFIYVGAFSEADSEQGRGGVRAGPGPISGRGGRDKTRSSFSTRGSPTECTPAKVRHDLSKPPLGCDSPILVKVVPIDRSLRYCFEHRTVVGSHSQQAAMTTPELKKLDGIFGDMLREQGSHVKVQVIRNDDCSQADVRCGVIANTTPKHFALECRNAEGQIFAQKQVEQAALGNTAWTVAESLLPRPGETHARKPGRLVILVDLSTSMVVNDEQTYIHNDVVESVRYGLVHATLDGLPKHGIPLQVSIMGFASNIVKAPNVGDADFSRLSLESQQAGLQWLKGVLEDSSPFVDGTDIVGALRAAKRALDSSAKSDAGYDAVILITDGSHRGSTAISVQDAAAELTDAGVKLHVIRVQLNDIEDFRRIMQDKNKRKAILARWFRFAPNSGWEKRSEDSGRMAWEDEITNTSAENNNGEALLDNLRSVKLTTLILSDDDQTRDPLITIQRFLLPNLGVRPTIDASDCGPTNGYTFSNGKTRWQKVCRIKHIPLGSEFAVKVSLHPCMRNTVEVNLQIPGSAVTLAESRDTSMNEVTAQFAPVQPGESTPGQSMGVTGDLIIISAQDPGEPCL